MSKTSRSLDRLVSIDDLSRLIPETRALLIALEESTLVEPIGVAAVTLALSATILTRMVAS